MPSRSTTTDRASGEYHLSIVAQAADVDELAHVSNITYVRWIQDVAAAHSQSVGLHADEYERVGGVFVVRKHTIEYLRSALAGDHIQLVTWVADFSGATSDRRTRMVRQRDGVELAQATTIWAYVSRSSGRPSRIPQRIIEAFLQPSVQSAE